MLLLNASLLLLQACLCLGTYGRNRFGPHGHRARHHGEQHAPNVTKHSMLQPLDHFNDTDTRNWTMLYYQRLDYWKPGGPLLIVTSAFDLEMNARRIAGKTNFYPVVANVTNGALFNPTARYNWDTNILSRNMTSFEYFTADQQLEDLAAFVRMLRAKPEFKDSKVVVMGRSYAGTLAVRFRAKYPHLAHAAWASGAPLLAKKTLPEYYETAGAAMKQSGYPNCYDKVEQQYKVKQQCFHNATCVDELRKYWHECNTTDFRLQGNRELYFNWFLDYDTNWIQEINVEAYCKYSTRPDTLRTRHRLRFENSCYSQFNLEYNLDWMKDAGSIKYNAQYYPMCAEFGHMQVATSDNQPFGNGVLTKYLWLRYCSELFGIEESDVEANVAATNRRWGGLTPRVTRAVFVTCEQDLMRNVTMQNRLLNDAVTLTVAGAPAWADTRVLPGEPITATRAKEAVLFYLQKWLAD